VVYRVFGAMAGGGALTPAAIDENPGNPPGGPAVMGVIGVGGPYELAIVPDETALDCGNGAGIGSGM
jgi:hypothetical protein